MTAKNETATDSRTVRKVFLVRPWHNQGCSLYPPVMDGVEYIKAVIKKIKAVFEREHADRFEVRVDEDVFVPGLTLRQNLIREITNADIVLVLLDGLRPNVVYELGFAYGQRFDADEGEDGQPQIVCLAEVNATVLVRNFYPEPMAVPTLDGQDVKILNPRLDVGKMFSDNADLLLLHYDRLDLDGTLGSKLHRLIEHMRQQEAKQGIASAGADSEMEAPSDEEEGSIDEEASASTSSVPSGGMSHQELWELYDAGQYRKIAQLVTSNAGPATKKVLALAFMKLGLIYEAIRVWRDLLADDLSSKTAMFHLGVCYYATSQFQMALYHFEQAKSLGDTGRTVQWINRTKRRIGQLRPAPAAAVTEGSQSASESSTDVGLQENDSQGVD